MKRCYALFILLLLLPSLAFSKLESYVVDFFSAPIPGWSKNRLVGEILADNSGFTIFDVKANALPFDDAESFKVDTPIVLPYGNKTISIDVEVEDEMVPLWQNRLMQFQINGSELPAAKLESGDRQFEKLYGEDGKGFVPAKSGRYVFEIDKAVTDIQFISFMTAGATNFGMKVSNVTFNVWPEEDVRTRPYLIRFNRLGYLSKSSQPVVLEWQDDLGVSELPLTISLSAGTKTTTNIVRGNKSSDSGVDITALGLEIDTATFTTLIIPETVKRTKHTTALFQIRDSLSEYEKQRDAALGAFYWFDMETYAGAHEQDKAATVFGINEEKDVFGGWYDAGDYGRYSVNGAFSVYMLLLSYIANESAFDVAIAPMNRRLDARKDILELVLPELLFLEKMQRDDGAVYHKVSSRDWPGINVPPVADLDKKFVMPVSTTATADVAAVMYLAAHIFGESELTEDQALAERFNRSADAASDFLFKNSDLIMIDDKYNGYEYGGPYTDLSDADERLLASVSRGWIDKKITADDKTLILSLAKKTRFSDPAPDWMNVNFLSVFSALFITQLNDLDFHNELKELVVKEFNFQLERQKSNPYGLIYSGNEDEFNWGSNGVIATLGSEFLWLENLTDDSKYWDAAYQMSHWFFGLNPHGIMFTTGSSRFNAKHPHFRPLISQAAIDPKGLLVGGPNSVELKGDIAASPLFNKAPMQVYIDHYNSWATNEVAINWQSAWASYLALLTAVK